MLNGSIPVPSVEDIVDELTVRDSVRSVVGFAHIAAIDGQVWMILLFL
jgi:hypothetical protein